MDIHRRVRQTAEAIALSAGATADVSIRLGVPFTMNDPDLDTVPANHSPHFFADEEALLVGVRTLANLAVDYMYAKER